MSAPPLIRVRPDKIGSVCLPFNLGPYVSVRHAPLAAEGAAVLARVLTARREYGHLELLSGRPAFLVPGDLIVGVLGARAALRGFCGRVPQELSEKDTLHLLNQGGVIGLSEGETVGLGEPIRLEVLGAPVRDGRPLALSDHALPAAPRLPAPMPPVLAVVGTCMNSGKTTAAAVIVRHLRGRGLRVHAGKATGIACIKDLLLFADHGASRTLSFLDCGLPSTCHHTDVPAVARTLLAQLAREGPEAIVLELGDGLLGAYGVDDILADRELAGCLRGAVLAANDVIGGWAGAKRLEEAGVRVLAITGPATDNRAGQEKLASFGWPAANIFREPDRLCELAAGALVPAPAGSAP